MLTRKQKVGSRNKTGYHHIEIIPSRHGNGKFYCFFRRVTPLGVKRIKMTTDIGSPEWLVDYAACLRGLMPKPRGETPKLPTIKEGTCEFYWNAYVASAKYKNFQRKGNRDSAWNRIVDLGLDQAVLAELTKKGLLKIIDAVAEKQWGAARNLRDTLFCLYAEADIPNPLAGTARPKSTTNPLGHYSWEEEDVELYRAYYPLGTKPRLALEIFLYTALRCVDARRAGKGTIRNGKVTLIQKKIEKEGDRARVTIPVHANLQTAIDACRVVGQLTWLVNDEGEMYTAGYLSASFARWCKAVPGLNPRCRAHGLRKACAKRLIDAGVSVPHAAAITGHLDWRELQHYAEARDRVLGAEIAMAAIA
jgi:integrase